MLIGATLGATLPACDADRGDHDESRSTRLDAPTGAVVGIVRYGAKAAPRQRIDISKETYCATHYVLHKEDLIFGDDGELMNVVAHVDRGLDTLRPFPTPSEPFELRMRGCRFIPHIVTLRVGQEAVFINEDPLMHNVKSFWPGRRASFHS